MKRVRLLMFLASVLVCFVGVPIASAPNGGGQGHYDYQGLGLGHEKHGDYGCSDCCVPPCEESGEGVLTSSVYQEEPLIDYGVIELIWITLFGETQVDWTDGFIFQ